MWLEEEEAATVEERAAANPIRKAFLRHRGFVLAVSEAVNHGAVTADEPVPAPARPAPAPPMPSSPWTCNHRSSEQFPLALALTLATAATIWYGDGVETGFVDRATFKLEGACCRDHRWFKSELVKSLLRPLL